MSEENIEDVISTQQPVKKRKPLKWLYLLTIPALIIALNMMFTTFPNSQKLSEDYRNNRVSITTYQRFGLMPNQLVIDLRGLNSDASMADVSRSVFLIAERMQTRDYDWVILAYKGKGKLKIDGDFFKEIGDTFDSQNPVYLIRTLPSEVYTMDGIKAYGTWTGGLLGVLNKQMADHAKMHEDWYLDELTYSK